MSGTSVTALSDTAQGSASVVDTSVWRLSAWLLQYARRRFLGLLAVVATMLVKIGLDVLKPWPMKVLVDNGLGQQPLPQWLAPVAAALPYGGDRQGVIAWSVIATVVLFLLTWALGVATTYANIGFGQRMVYDLAGDLFSHLQRLSLRFHSRKSVGDSIRRVTTDCGCVSVIIKDAVLPLFTSAISLVAMFAVMWRLEPRMTLLSLIVLPWMAYVLHRYMNPILERSYEQQEVEGQMYDVVEQTLTAMPVVQAFGREHDRDAQFRRTTTAATDAAVRSAVVGLKFKIFTGAATAVGTAAVLWVGAQSVLAGQLTVGGILVFMAYLASLYGPLEALMYTPSTTQAAAGSARRVLEILDTKQEVHDLPDARPAERLRGHLRFDEVTFGYDSPRRVLENVSLEVSPGESLAIVGPTGAGKSTLVSLIPRFYDPWGGRVLVDGHDVRSLQLKSLRSQVAVVLQEAFLFPVSIAANIAYGRPDATREEIEKAARVANAHDFIQRLPSGYDTVVGQRGATLSGGERQRIAVARAVLKNAPILILDEPTSAVDAETEALLVQALERLMAGRTTIIIAHRLSTIVRAHRIVVLEDGHIAESGTHAELLRGGGTYARYHALQFGNRETPA